MNAKIQLRVHPIDIPKLCKCKCTLQYTSDSRGSGLHESTLGSRQSSSVLALYESTLEGLESPSKTRIRPVQDEMHYVYSYVYSLYI